MQTKDAKPISLAAGPQQAARALWISTSERRQPPSPRAADNMHEHSSNEGIQLN
jgi:hypothetical protein